MSDFRMGDHFVEIAARRVRLRLTVSALAEMTAALGAQTPRELAEILRRSGAREWNIILQAVATPPPPDGLSAEEIAGILPSLTALIIEGLGA